MAQALVGQSINAVWVDSEVTYIMLANGTQISIKGWVFVEPKPAPVTFPSSAGISL
jgi:hypothetical protein